MASWGVGQMWCPCCSAELVAPDDSTEVSCPACGSRVRVAAARNAAAWWERAHRIEADRDRAQAIADDLHSRATQADAQAADLARQADEARRNVTGWFAAARFDAPEVSAPAPAAQAPRSWPVSLLLQGSGALLLLTALVAGSAVAWDSFPAVVQASLLIALVLVAGAVSVWIGRTLPTTGTVLSVLTVAGGLVVGATLPTILPELWGTFYPAAACALGSVALLGAGRAAGNAVWRRSGAVMVGVTAAVLVVTLVGILPLSMDSTGWWAVLALLSVPPIAGAFAVSAASGDPETRVLARWVGWAGLAASLGALGVGVLVWMVQLADGSITAGERLLLCAACVGLAAVAAAQGARTAAALALAPLPLVLVAPLQPVSIGQAILAAAVPVAAAAGCVLAARWRPALDGPLTAGAAAGLVQLLLLVGLIYATPDSGYSWLLTLLLGLGFGGLAVAFGLADRRLPQLLGGLALIGLAWAWAYSSGHLGPDVEWLTIPLGGAALGVWWIARRRSMPVPGHLAGQAIVVAAVLPSAVQTWSGIPIGPAWRVALVLAGIAAVCWWAAVRRTGWTLPVAFAAAVAMGWTETWVADEPFMVFETWWLPMAAALCAVLAAGAADGWIARPWAGALGLVLLAGPSWTVLLVEPAWSVEVGVRLLFVEAALLVLMERARGRAARAAAAALVVLTPAWIWAVWATAQSWFEPELVTVPLAVAAVLAARRVLPDPAARGGIGRWAFLAVAAVSTATALTFGRLPSDDAVDVLRVVVLVAGWIAAAVLARGAWRQAWCGTAAIVLAWVNLVSVVTTGESPAVELWSLPTAAALGAIGVLLRRARQGDGSAPVGSILWLGPAVSMALLPTALVAWSDGTAGARVWASLLAGAAVLCLGVWLRWAGLVVPALATLALLVVPVLLRLVGDLPVWLPLTLVGLALLTVGARLEAARRESRRALEWAIRLR